ncbi:MAG: hypothetical protein V4543_05275 [Bacteroidota bacterium]
MNKLYLLCTVLFLLSFGAGAQSLNCAKFKEGKFLIKSGNGDSLIVVRKNNIQTEYHGNDEPDRYMIEWIGNCTFLLRPTEAVVKKYPDTPKGIIMKVTILSTSKNSYKHTISHNFGDDVLTFEGIKLKDY